MSENNCSHFYGTICNNNGTAVSFTDTNIKLYFKLLETIQYFVKVCSTGIDRRKMRYLRLQAFYGLRNGAFLIFGNNSRN